MPTSRTSSYSQTSSRTEFKHANGQNSSSEESWIEKEREDNPELAASLDASKERFQFQMNEIGERINQFAKVHEPHNN